MTKFLTLKHWQLFLLLIGIPLIFQFVIIGFTIASRNPAAYFIYFPIITILIIGLSLSWSYSLGTNLYKRLPVTAKMSLTRFKIFLFFPGIYMIFFLVFMAGLFSDVSSGREPNPGILFLIFPLHLFAMFCLFYCLYFNAKALKTVELQRPVTFSDYAGEFFLLWFFPIGIWIIQPRVNRLFATTPDDSGDSIFDGYSGR